MRLKGSVLDVGSKKSISNVTNYLNTEEKINYADKFAKDPNDLTMDLEEIIETKDKVYKNVLLFNVLEHVFNFKNCLIIMTSNLGAKDAEKNTIGLFFNRASI